jgi:hypothetical protein
MIDYLLYTFVKNNNKDNQTIEAFSSSGGDIIGLIISLTFGFMAAILSWNCNSKLHTGTGLKILYAFIAWFFGLFYLIFYFFANYLGNGCGI